MRKFGLVATTALGGLIGGAIIDWSGNPAVGVPRWIVVVIQIGVGVGLASWYVVKGRLRLSSGRSILLCLLISAVASSWINELANLEGTFGAWLLSPFQLWSPLLGLPVYAVVLAPMSFAARRLDISVRSVLLVATCSWAGSFVTNAYDIGGWIGWRFFDPSFVFVAAVSNLGGLTVGGTLPQAVSFARRVIRAREGGSTTAQEVTGFWRRFRQNPDAEMLHACLLVLPAAVRERYYREWLADLAMLEPGERRRFMLSLMLTGIPRMAISIRVPLPWRAPWGS